MPDTETEYESIYVLMGRILAELPAIGKDQENRQQGFKFRGYDDVLNALNPLLARHGVFFTCEVLERETAERTTRNDNALYVVNLHNRYRFWGPRGDYILTEAWGEGTDSGDKATPKAMTGALKYALFQVYAISTEEAANTDADRHTPDESRPTTYVACPHCGADIADDAQAKRGHLERVHGWVRQADGTVAPPETAEEPPEGAVAPAPSKGPDAPKPEPAEPELEAAVESVVTADAEPAPEPDGEVDVSYVDDLKGQELMAEAERVGVSKAGRVAEVRERIKEALTSGDDDEPEDDSPDDEPPADAPEDDTGGDTPADTPADDSGEQDAPGDPNAYACPECPDDAPGFPTEEAYHEHWWDVHDPEKDDEGDDGPEPDEPAVDHTAIKGRITSLTGANARAYGKYRREQNLPRPDEMDAEQVAQLNAFLDELGA